MLAESLGLNLVATERRIVGHMSDRVHTLLILALPASGKSELRRYLASLDDEVAATDLGLGPIVQLDDYPYVHLMRRISQTLRSLDGQLVFFASDDEPLLEGDDWATLIELVNQDYAALGTDSALPAEPTAWLLERFDAARRLVGLEATFRTFPSDLISALSAALDEEVAAFALERKKSLALYRPEVSTVLVEFARGGPEGTVPPLPEPHGYAFSLGHLSPEILASASALYVWVTPEDSRRRNVERTVPGREGDASILHHGVPELVMRRDYGIDDFHWLLEQGGGDELVVRRSGVTHRVPAAVFDNRNDQTSFLRADPAAWNPARVGSLHAALVEVFAAIRPSGPD